MSKTHNVQEVPNAVLITVGFAFVATALLAYTGTHVKNDAWWAGIMNFMGSISIAITFMGGAFFMFTSLRTVLVGPVNDANDTDTKTD